MGGVVESKSKSQGNLHMKRIVLILGLLTLVSVHVNALLTVEVINDSSCDIHLLDLSELETTSGADKKGFLHGINPATILMSAKSGKFILEDIESLDDVFFNFSARPHNAPEGVIMNFAASSDLLKANQTLSGDLPVVISIHKSRGLPHFLDWIPEWLYPAEGECTYTIHIKDSHHFKDEL